MVRLKQMRLLRLLNLLPFFWACSSIAQPLPGDPLVGGKLAREVCAGCHIVSDDQLVDPDVGAPTFFDVVADPSVSELSLRAFLQTSHPTMPNLILTPDETDDIISYILTLKGVQQ
jgi:mono/diheme cytochrome c family protein